MSKELEKVDYSKVKPIEDTHPIYAALEEIQKPRTRFQLEHFVVGQHDTDAQQYKQVLLELQGSLYTYRIALLQMKKVEIEIKKLRESGDELDELDAQIKEIELEKTDTILIGARRELADLVEIWELFDHKYTYDEIEADQMQYWNLRLTRQAQLEAIGKGGQVDWGSLDALRQIGQFDNAQVEANLDKVKELQ